MQHSEKFVSLVNEAKTRIKEISTDCVKQKLENNENFYLIDSREYHEWLDSHLPQATFISKGVIEMKIHEIVKDPQAEIVVYCGGGYRSALAVDNLQNMGYKNVSSMTGGISEWRQKRYPLEK